MRVRRFVLASVLSISSISASGTGASAQPKDVGVPLGIAARLNAGGDSVELELTNHGSKTAVAWSIKIVGLPSVDGRPPNIHIGQDLYWQLATSVPIKPPFVAPLPPKGRVVVQSLSSTAYPGASFVAVCVVYSDDTAVGDEERIEGIFKGRARDARELKEVSVTLNEVTKGTITRASVEAAIRILETGMGADRAGGGGMRQGAVRDLRYFLKSPWSLQSSVEDLATRTNKYAENAATHAIRRQGTASPVHIER